jgi:hypothetical protein
LSHAKFSAGVEAYWVSMCADKRLKRPSIGTWRGSAGKRAADCSGII